MEGACFISLTLATGALLSWVLILNIFTDFFDVFVCIYTKFITFAVTGNLSGQVNHTSIYQYGLSHNK